MSAVDKRLSLLPHQCLGMTAFIGENLGEPLKSQQALSGETKGGRVRRASYTHTPSKPMTSTQAAHAGPGAKARRSSYTHTPSPSPAPSSAAASVQAHTPKAAWPAGVALEDGGAAGEVADPEAAAAAAAHFATLSSRVTSLASRRVAGAGRVVCVCVHLCCHHVVL